MLSCGDGREFPPRTTRTCSAATSGGRSCRCPTGDRFAWDEASTYIRNPPFFEQLSTEAAPLAGPRRRARAGGARRQRHDRPHLAGWVHPGRQPGREVPDRARRAAEGLQLVRRAARQPRGDDARHVRQHPPAQPARAGYRGRLDAAPARRRADDDLRRGDAVQAGRRAAARHRRQGVRLGLVARLGRQGHGAARRPGGDRGELRADPPQQPREHGRAAAAVRAGRDGRHARADRPRDLRDPGHRLGAQADGGVDRGRTRGGAAVHRVQGTRAHRHARGTVGFRPAASSLTCCGSWSK